MTALAAPPAVPPALSPLLAWLVAQADVAPEALAAAAGAAPEAMLPNADTPEPLARALAATGAPFAALRVVGAALPPREGIWWAWVAVRHTLHALAERGPTAPAAHAASAAVERWILEPTDANRRAAWAAGQAADLATPAGCLCGAVFFAGGSIAAPQSPMAVPPPPGGHVTMAASAVLMAAAALDPGRLTEILYASVAQAAAVAGRLGGWLPAATAARRHYDAQREQHAAAVDAATPKSPPPT